jgi:hypothetical protein
LLIFGLVIKEIEEGHYCEEIRGAREKHGKTRVEESVTKGFAYLELILEKHVAY